MGSYQCVLQICWVQATKKCMVNLQETFRQKPFPRRAQQTLIGGQSSPQELEERLHGGQNLLVKLKETSLLSKHTQTKSVRIVVI